jgi:nitrogen PTS system EIIA component
MLMGGGEPAPSGPAGRRGSLVDARLVFSNLPGSTREDALRELSYRIGALGLVPDAGTLASRLLEREKLGCTGLGGGIAIPHCKLPDLAEVLIAVATTAAPIDFGAADGVPVRVLFLVASPAAAAAAHLQALARISRLLRIPGVVDALRAADSAGRLLDILREAEAALQVPS